MKKKISHLEADRLRACRREFSISQKIMRALGARNINFARLDRLHVEYLAAIDRIGTAENALHRHRVNAEARELADYFRSFFTPSPIPA